ncbi:DNA replication and repair protein RecF [bacterium]|nr:MAG: DNA replication and repair protein RecF [bacterium]
MIISSIRIQNLRTHTDFSHTLSPHVTLILGRNGSGKTSIIEAITVALQGTSFKGSDTELLKYDAEWWRVDVANDEDQRIVKFDPSKTTGRKQFSIDEKHSYRLSPTHKYPVVLFEPDDLRLLSGSPTRRRQFIDRFISQIDPTYAQALRKYDRALKQRNNLLKQQTAAVDDLFVWDVAISEYGAVIIEKRIVYIEQLNSQLNATYNTIAQSADTVSIHYSHTVIGDIKQRLMSELHSRIERDRLMGYTSVGPHRHDIVFMFNAMPALSVASRGEVRSIVLAMKFLEVDIIAESTGRQPLILLDDVFGELDSDRQTHLTTKFQGRQIIMTSASSAAVIDDAMTITLT